MALLKSSDLYTSVDACYCWSPSSAVSDALILSSLAFVLTKSSGYFPFVAFLNTYKLYTWS